MLSRLNFVGPKLVLMSMLDLPAYADCTIEMAKWAFHYVAPPECKRSELALLTSAILADFSSGRVFRILKSVLARFSNRLDILRATGCFELG